MSKFLEIIESPNSHKKEVIDLCRNILIGISDIYFLFKFMLSTRILKLTSFGYVYCSILVRNQYICVRTEQSSLLSLKLIKFTIKI